MAACEALKALDYYRARWRETHALRAELQLGLERLGWNIVTGCANFLLCHLPTGGPNAALVIARARVHGVFLRDVASMGTRMDDRTLRVAVKDRATNQRMLQSLQTLLGEIGDASMPEQRRTAWA
jgi:histidinol-phosphate/aromatic aminotransferase/cobyric acid decarboxylase-like protein